ncbi:hypothetical protein M407DRAFT_243646 [Tulasnella calospora MUT 4182]|uniref:Uncharacterized protein n=1 Tax=Tulasnella calospora MUT 4182 TaxID=1051891 RepID=A0A0C3Q9G3_9AGAM|nr:hypothetical protein M407DRAFT_243646 [Tulasnella calospora MUT 4182]
MAIRECDDLRRIALGRPAFKHLSVDSTCLQRSKQVGQDLDVLREYFDVVVTDQQ